MVKFLRKIIKVFLIILSPFLLVGILAYLAIYHNFWPPTCGFFPVPNARMVCEFSKIDKVNKDESATYTFWVTVPQTPSGEVWLAIDGQPATALKVINNSSYQGTALLKTGSEIKYHYTLGKDGASSENFTLKVTRKNRTVYDSVNNWNGTESTIGLNSKLDFGVAMFDTWTINYNFNFFEDTRRTLKSSMDRAVALGAKRFDVFDMFEMTGTKDDFSLQPIDSPFKYFRDASIKPKEMKIIAKEGKKRGLETIIHYNVQSDYSAAFGDMLKGKIAYGTGGNDAEAAAGKTLGRDEIKTEQYLDRLFLQLEALMVQVGKDAQTAGIDGIDITPQYRFPKSDPLQAYADEKYLKVITSLRQVFKGKIYASNFASFGGLSGVDHPRYIDAVDGLYIYLGAVENKLGSDPTPDSIAAEYEKTLNKLKNKFSTYQKPIYLVTTIGSYNDFYNGKPGTEWNDFVVVDKMGYKEDWQEQADGYEGLFRALARVGGWAGIYTGGYWYDDFMAPRYMNPRNNMMATVRNKPAEAVIKKWIKSVSK